MKKDYILFIDSGIGGLSTLCKIYKILPANYIYFADTKNAPYGNKTADKIYKFLKEIIISVSKQYNIKIVVLACNTATTTSINKLRSEFSTIHFIGTEPAIMLAYKLNYKHILCVATNATVKQKKYQHLVSSLNADIKSLGLKSFAKNIEEYFCHKSFWAYFECLKILYQIAAKSSDVDCLVLGCTHYVYFKEKLKKIINKQILDGNYGVLKQVYFWHAKICDKNISKKHIKFLFSSDKKTLTQIYKKIFHEILAKV
jgi:glutamate racemase